MTKRAKIYLLAAVVFILIFNVFFGLFLMQRNTKPESEIKPTVAIQNNIFSYKGEDGKDALTILKEKIRVEESSSGLVISINNRKAEEDNKEFWAFYVNGKMAEVGPSDYQTKDGDLIEWKIQKY
ncbi:MAG: DUF4430 domain-containing protein [Candidatus Levybacteria bacterium]|nr:DUF4430 domain-containing protein [Candidatus Levybacteria bacterium]